MKVTSISRESGKATVELFGKTRELEASFYGEPGTDHEHAVVWGIAVRYPTGTKVWHGSFTYWMRSGNINNIHTPMEHRSRWAHVSVVGFYADAKEQYRSQRPSRY